MSRPRGPGAGAAVGWVVDVAAPGQRCEALTALRTVRGGRWRALADSVVRVRRVASRPWSRCMQTWDNLVLDVGLPC